MERPLILPVAPSNPDPRLSHAGFDDGDLRISVRQLHMYLADNENVPFDALKWVLVGRLVDWLAGGWLVGRWLVGCGPVGEMMTLVAGNIGTPTTSQER